MQQMLRWTIAAAAAVAFAHFGAAAMAQAVKQIKLGEAQIEDRYRNGGGWRPLEGFRLKRKTLTLSYPGDTPFRHAAACQLPSPAALPISATSRVSASASALSTASDSSR